MLTAKQYAPLVPDPTDRREDVDGNPLDLHDDMEAEIPVLVGYSHEATCWIAESDCTLFAQGSPATDPFAKEDAYSALAMTDQVCSAFGLGANMPTVCLADVRSQPPNLDEGYDTDEKQGHLPNMTAVMRFLLQHHDFISRNQMVYLIVDNRKPDSVPHWPAFASWWASRRLLVGPQEESTDVLRVCADDATGLRNVPYHWAGVFVLEAARFLFPKQHFALIDNDCAPVTLFEIQDLVELAQQQFQWTDLVGYRRPPAGPPHRLYTIHGSTSGKQCCVGCPLVGCRFCPTHNKVQVGSCSESADLLGALLFLFVCMLIVGRARASSPTQPPPFCAAVQTSSLFL